MEKKGIYLLQDVKKALANMNRILASKENRISSFFCEENSEMIDDTLFYNDYYTIHHISQEEVEAHPRKYIIEELIQPCILLWGKNIFTFTTSNSTDSITWISIKLQDLSTENIAFIDSLQDKDIVKFSKHKGVLELGVTEVGEKASERLIEICSGFKMQDVPCSATIPLKKALIQCGYYYKKQNPSYLTLEEYQKKFGTLSYGHFSRYFDSPYAIPYTLEFDGSSIKKPIHRILSKRGYLFDGDIIYKNRFYYNKHLNYLRYLETIEEIQALMKKM